MSLIDGLYNSVEGIFAWLSKMLKQDALTYCDIEAADSHSTLVSKDGSLLSIINLNGFNRFIGGPEFQFLCQRLSEILQPSFNGTGQYVQFYFSRDNENIGEDIMNALGPAIQTAQKLNLNITDIFESRKQTLEKFCATENCYIVIWTSPAVFEKTHLNLIRKRFRESFKSAKLPKVGTVQNVLNVLPELRNMHNSTVDTIVEDFRQTGFYLDLLEAHVAVRVIRKIMDPDFTADDWTPFLPNDPLPLRKQPDIPFDISDIFWPPLDRQIMPREANNLDLRTVQIGDRIYAPLYIELFPRDIKPFYDLFRRAIATADMPWRILYMLSPDGIKIASSKHILSQFLSFASQNNKLINESFKYLKAVDERSDDPIIQLTVCLVTSAKANEPDVLKARAARLAKIVQSWGGCDVRDVSGDPFGTTVSSIPGFTKSPTASATSAPLSDAVSMLPFIRPASPWEHGALLFRTPDGKLMPYQPGSNKQISWIDLIYARSGSGKSVLLSAANLGLCLSSGLSNLPRISILDVGPSSRGFISLLREGLPKDQQHLVRYHRLKLEDSHAINPFDTQLGARYPTRLHRAFLVNFISLLLVDNIEDRPPEGMSSMLSMIVDEAYKRFDDNEQPKLFVPHTEALVDQAIQNIGLEIIPNETTWWEITDALFAANEKTLALLAQRHAVPTIADTIGSAHTPGIKDLFGKVSMGTGEDYITAYCRIIASVIRNFPTLTCITRLDLEGARIISLDLDEVAKGGSAVADKQTAIMYMLGRHMIAQNFFLHSEDVKKFPEAYKAHHTGRIKEIMEEPKRMVFDEFHRTAKSPAVRDQVVQDMREGRKWKIHVALSSQSLTDFDPIMVEFATSIFILDSGSSLAIEQTVKTFGLSDTEKLALSTRVHGPRSEGATFIAQFVTKTGINTQLLTSTISPVELWAFNTTTEDVFIRDSLYQQIGPAAARELLAQAYPKGSAISEIDAMLKADPSTTIAELADTIVKDLVTSYRRKTQRSQLQKI